MDFSDILAFVGLTLVTLLAFVLRYVILLVGYGLAEFPQVTTFIFALGAIYVAYKVAKRMVKFWIGLIITTVKTVFVLSLVLLGLAVYIRGFQRFFHRDIYFLGSMIQNSLLALENVENFDPKSFAANYASKLAADENFDTIKDGAKQWMRNNGVGDQYVEMVEDQMHQVKDNAGEYINEGLNYLNEQGINFDNLNENLGNLNIGNLGNFFGNR